jgi:hypothetical protein
MAEQMTIRAYRPSQYAEVGEESAESRRVKELSMRLYTRLIEQGKPLFEEPGSEVGESMDLPADLNA